MRRTNPIGALLALLLLGAAAGPAASPAVGQTVVGQIDGSPSLVGVRSLPVSPNRRSDTSTLIDAGTIDTEGFATIVVNLAGLLMDSDPTGGEVGVLLIPDIAPFDKAFTTASLLPSPLELTVPVSTRTSNYFMATQQKFDVGFPRYRVLFYNSTNSTVNISFFAYRAR